MWKRLFKSYFNTVLVVLIIAVIVGSLFLSELIGGACILVMIGGILIVLVIMSFMGMIIEMAFHLEEIEKNTKNIGNISLGSGAVNQNVALFGRTNLSEVAAQGSIVSNPSNPAKKLVNWTCTNCGLINPSYQTTCKCGTSKADAEEVKAAVEKKEVIDKESWTCKDCGAINPNKVFVCKCGMKKSVNNGEKVKASDEVKMALKAAEEKNKADLIMQEKAAKEAEEAKRKAEEKEKARVEAFKKAEQEKVENEKNAQPQNIDANGNPYFFDANGTPYYIAQDGNAYYYQ